MTSLTIRAFPLNGGSVDDLKAFIAEINGPRSEEACRFYRRYGVVREVWHLQHTETCPLVIAVTEMEDADEAFPRYAKATEEYDVWFQTQVLRLSGVDPKDAPRGPASEEIFSWIEPAD
jgi:hypothetical protein